MFLSSHLLDEVEKTCDQVAIVDRGLVDRAGPRRRDRGSGEPTVLIEIDDPTRRGACCRPTRASPTSSRRDAELRITLGRRPRPAAEVNRALVNAGVARCSRLEPARATLRGEVPRSHLQIGDERMRLIEAES